MARGKDPQARNGGANIGFEQKLWDAADILRGNVDPAEYKHIVLGLLFLKYISDAFLERRQAIIDDPEWGPDYTEQKDAYTMESVLLGAADRALADASPRKVIELGKTQDGHKGTKKNSKRFEETLWDSANKLRGSVEPADAEDCRMHVRTM